MEADASSADYSDVGTRRQGFVGSREHLWDVLLPSAPSAASYNKYEMCTNTDTLFVGSNPEEASRKS